MAKYQEYIMQKVRGRIGLEDLYDTSRDDEIDKMSHNEVFDHCLNWEGLINYGDSIRNWVFEIYGISLS